MRYFYDAISTYLIVVDFTSELLVVPLDERLNLLVWHIHAVLGEEFAQLAAEKRTELDRHLSFTLTSSLSRKPSLFESIRLKAWWAENAVFLCVRILSCSA